VLKRKSNSRSGSGGGHGWRKPASRGRSSSSDSAPRSRRPHKRHKPFDFDVEDDPELADFIVDRDYESDVSSIVEEEEAVSTSSDSD